jgi:hypothetical protein
MWEPSMGTSHRLPWKFCLSGCCLYTDLHNIYLGSDLVTPTSPPCGGWCLGSEAYAKSDKYTVSVLTWNKNVALTFSNSSRLSVTLHIVLACLLTPQALQCFKNLCPLGQAHVLYYLLSSPSVVSHSPHFPANSVPSLALYFQLLAYFYIVSWSALHYVFWSYDRATLIFSFNIYGGTRWYRVKALCYKPEVRAFEIRWGDLFFFNVPNVSSRSIFGVYSTTNRNWIPEAGKLRFWGVERGRCVGLTTLQPSVNQLSRQSGILKISNSAHPVPGYWSICHCTGRNLRYLLWVENESTQMSGPFLPSWGIVTGVLNKLSALCRMKGKHFFNSFISNQNYSDSIS